MVDINMPRQYRRCSCGKFLGTHSRNSIRRHREMGHRIPLKRYKASDII